MAQQYNNGWAPDPNNQLDQMAQVQAMMTNQHQQQQQQQQQQMSSQMAQQHQMMMMMQQPQSMMYGGYAPTMGYGASMPIQQSTATTKSNKDGRSSLEKKRLRNRVNQAKLRVREKSQNSQDRAELKALRSSISILDDQLDDLKKKLSKYESETPAPPWKRPARVASPTSSEQGFQSKFSDQGSTVEKPSDQSTGGASYDQGSTGKSIDSVSTKKSSGNSSNEGNTSVDNSR